MAATDGASDGGPAAEPSGGFPYHKNAWEEQEYDGYRGKLTEKQAAALTALRDAVGASLPGGLGDLDRHLRPPGESRDHLLLRFLRARKFDVGKAREMLEADLEWRGNPVLGGVGCGFHEMCAKTDPIDVLGCTEEQFELVQRNFPMVLAGFDRQHRPVLYKKLGGNCVVSDVVDHVPTEELVRYHVWSTEHALMAAAKRSAEQGCHVERIVVVVDAKDWYVSLFSSAARKYLRGIADMDSAHYPERLGSLVVVNAPLVLSTAWAVIRLWLDERTLKKVQILRGPDAYEPVLKKLIADDQLLSEYGGTLDAPFNNGIFAPGECGAHHVYDGNGNVDGADASDSA